MGAVALPDVLFVIQVASCQPNQSSQSTPTAHHQDLLSLGGRGVASGYARYALAYPKNSLKLAGEFFYKGLQNPTSTSRDVHSLLLQTTAGSEIQQTKIKTRSID
jgi:hypothetical protein